MTRDSRYWWLNPMLVCFACFGIGFSASQIAKAQLVPPPPVRAELSDSFNEQDRYLARATYKMVRALHAKMFPFAEEEKILRGGTSEIRLTP